MKIRFLSVERVLLLHRMQLDRFGGLDGVRDANLLESAVASPQAMFGGQYLYAGPIEMASAYLFHLAKNHPFFDGNKRVAAATAVAFLELNGFQFVANDDAYADLVLEVARGNADKPAIADFLRANVTPV